MEKRTRQWRRYQAARVFKARMKYHATFNDSYFMKDGTLVRNPHWFVLAQTPWAKVYKSVSTPCSCWMCRGEKYNRLEAKREMERILKEEEM